MLGINADLILQVAKQYGEAMIRNLRPTVTALLGSFLIIDLVLSFMFDESEDLNIFIKLIKKILYYGFFIWIIQDYSNLIFKTLMGGAIQLGNVAAGKGASTSINIELISKFGIDMGDLKAAFGVGLAGTLLDILGVESVTTVMLMGAMGYIIFFIMLYVQILTIFVKFYLIGGFAFILMPFGVFTKTKDITLKALNGLFSNAIEIFVLVVILNLAANFMDGAFSETVKSSVAEKALKENIWNKAAILAFMFLLINKAGALSSALLSGAIASIGIGANAGARGFDNAVSAPGNIVRGMTDRASSFQGDREGAGGAKAFRKNSPAANAYTKAANFMKNYIK